MRKGDVREKRSKLTYILPIFVLLLIGVGCLGLSKSSNNINKENDKINENLSEVKNKIETKQKESNQKVLNFENQLKDKINSKLPTVKTQPQVKETVEKTIEETKE